MASLEKLTEYRKAYDNFDSMLGITTTEMRPGYAKGEMKIDKRFENVVNSVHGGCIYSLADAVGGSAAISYGHRVTTVSSDFHFLSPAIGVSMLYATAREIKHGKRILVYDLEISDDKGKLIAKGTFTYFNLGTPVIPQEA